ncbi:MAG: hypothetical protein HYS20_11615 [Rhodocyclales bacterium]|nr:hypothetical protein [Rhodocyclales bacterium]
MSAAVLALGATAGTQLQLDLGRLDHPAFSLENLRVELGEEGRASLVTAGRLSADGRVFDNVRLECARLHLAAGELDCRDGRLTVPGWGAPANIELRLNPARGSASIKLRGAELGAVSVDLTSPARATVSFTDLSLAAASAMLAPAAGDWGVSGRFNGRLVYRSDGARSDLSLTGKLQDGAFASADGLNAAEHVDLDIDVVAHAGARGQGWKWRAESAWTHGEAYLHPLYLTSGARLSASGLLTASRLDLDHASLSLAGVRAIEASGSLDLVRRHVLRGGLAVAEAELEQIGPRYILPLLAPERAASTSFSGKLSAGIMIDGGQISGLDLAFDRAGFSQTTSDLDFGPVDGTVAWRSDAVTTAALAIGAGRWQKLTLGAFAVNARLSGHSVDVDRIAIPVLDGKLVLTDLALRRDREGWSGSGAAVIEPISMRLLTTAVGLPPMSGVLAASMPGMRVRPGEVALDGALVISVFDGYLQATHLKVIEPLGVAARLYADVEARRIDLAQLTETFSFGSVSGFVDADVLGLELVRWRPVRFDARVLSSPGAYRRRISQRAVQNIGALGGPGAALALQRGFLQFFESFGYREIGLSCKLARGVCRMGGLQGDNETDTGRGFPIIQGGGIPALNVIGYNRRVDWEELLARLQRVIESNAAPVIQ